MSESGLNSPYRYRFERPSRGSNTLVLQREIRFYQERIRLAPEDGLSRAMLASTYLKMARATGEGSWYLFASQAAQQSLAKLPFHNDGAILVLARIAIARHDFPAAIRLVEQLNLPLEQRNSKAGETPTPQEIWSNYNKPLQHTNSKAGETPTSQEIWSKPNPKSQIPNPKLNEDALSILVTANLAMGKISAASQAANILVEKTPTIGALTLRGLVQIAAGKDQLAINDFKQALAVEEAEETGSSVWTRTLLGRLYYKQGELKLARQLYQEALRILPEYPPALLNLAQLEVRLGNYRAAENYYSQFFSFAKNAPNIYDHAVMRGLARVKELSGDKSGAQLWRQKEEARLREDVVGFGHRRELARLLLEQGDTNRSLQKFKPKAGETPTPQEIWSRSNVQEALTLMQAEVYVRRDPETLSTFASVLARLNRLQEARVVIQEALRTGIRDPGLFDQAGTIEQALGNQSEAQAFFQLALESDRTFDRGAKRALGLGIGLLGL